MNELLSPSAAVANRKIMAGHWSPPDLSPAEDAQAAERLYWRSLGLPAPSLDDLQKHAERYGIEGVRETARLYGVQWTNEKSTKITAKAGLSRKRRTNDELRREVFDLHERGLMVAPIADAVNISDRRVAEILAGPRPDPVPELALSA